MCTRAVDAATTTMAGRPCSPPCVVASGAPRLSSSTTGPTPPGHVQSLDAPAGSVRPVRGGLLTWPTPRYRRHPARTEPCHDRATTGRRQPRRRRPAFAGGGSTAPDNEVEIVDGDAATHLEALVFGAVAPAPPTAGAEGLPIELVGQHLRLSGTVIIGFHRRLTDFVNNHDGLIQLRDVTVLRRNGDPTKVTSPSIWVSPDEVTLIGQATDVEEREIGGDASSWRRRRTSSSS